MNENLKKLMIQADYPAPEIAKRAHVLAELIVRECADVIDQVQSEGGDFVRRHFGVEE